MKQIVSDMTSGGFLSVLFIVCLAAAVGSGILNMACRYALHTYRGALMGNAMHSKNCWKEGLELSRHVLICSLILIAVVGVLEVIAVG